LATAVSRSVPASPEVDASPQRKSKLPAVLSAGIGLGGIVVGSVPGARRAVRKLIGQEALDLGKPPSRASSSTASSQQSDGSDSDVVDSPAAKPKPVQSDASDAQRFTLTPDKLATISDFNPQLEEIVGSLDSVPVFTAAVGNGTSPLTVPADNGRKLAYFFTEHADAEAFLGAVRENIGAELQAQVIGVSLSDIVRAYSSTEAKEAKETFVLIPTMAEVAVARRLIVAAKAETADTTEDTEDDLAKLGPGNGLVPIFWSDALAVQTAGGKQRKVLFFRFGDLQQMWKGLADARKESGELDDLPEGPTVQVSSLQSMAGLLASANKTDDVMFLPSSSALRRAQAGRQPEASGGGGSDAVPSSEEDADTSEDVVDASEAFGDGFEGEEEDATGGAI